MDGPLELRRMHASVLGEWDYDPSVYLKLRWSGAIYAMQCDILPYDTVNTIRYSAFPSAAGAILHYVRFNKPDRRMHGENTEKSHVESSSFPDYFVLVWFKLRGGARTVPSCTVLYRTVMFS